MAERRSERGLSTEPTQVTEEDQPAKPVYYMHEAHPAEKTR
jgi:hypothetical protein